MEKEAALYLNTFEGPSPKDHLCCQITSMGKDKNEKSQH